MKTCIKCKIEKPFEAFCKSKDRKDGYISKCKECEKLRRLELKKNPLLQLERQIRSSIILENKLLKRENKKLCVGCKEVFLIEDLVGGKICKECSGILNKKYVEENSEKFKESVKKYREKNKEYIKEYKKEYREKNKENIKKYRREHSEKNKEYQRQYYLKKKPEKLQNNDTQI